MNRKLGSKKVSYKDLVEGGKDAQKFYGLQDREVSQKLTDYMTGASAGELRDAHAKFYNNKS